MALAAFGVQHVYTDGYGWLALSRSGSRVSWYYVSSMPALFMIFHIHNTYVHASKSIIYLGLSYVCALCMFIKSMKRKQMFAIYYVDGTNYSCHKAEYADSAMGLKPTLRGDCGGECVTSGHPQS